MYRTAIELTYGLTDNVEAAAYLNLAHPDADSFQYAGSKFRLRGSLFEQGELPVDLGWYVELEWHKTPQFDDSELELELRADHREGLPVRDRSQSDLREGDLRRSRQEQGLRVRLRGGHLLQLPALDFAGPRILRRLGLIDDNDPLHEQQHYIFPVVSGELPGGIEYNVGPGIGLTRGSDQVIMKFNLELEHFIGTLF